MAPLSLKSNVSALTVQRMFGRNTNQLSQSFTRLSTGLRINRAVDDAAGLAIASSLDADSRVYTQGIRNINDGISLTNVADGALAQLSNIGIRLQELAEQAANGTYSNKQREPLDREADELVNEFNRILEVTNFNGKNLLAGAVDTFRIQIGYGENESLSFQLGGELGRDAGDGTFQSELATHSNNSTSIAFGDFNGDSILDLVSLQANSGGRARVKLGVGDGTFVNSVEYSLSSNGPASVEIADVNNDGNLDILSISTSGDDFDVALGVGDGTFGAVINHSIGHVSSIAVGDLNGDGNVDVAGVNDSSGQDIRIMLGQGDGNFVSGTTVSYTGIGSAIEMADLDNDGSLDLVVGNDDSNDTNDLFVFKGNGNATFQAGVSYGAGVGVVGDAKALATGDYNGDGRVDVAAVGDGYLSIFLGNGDTTLASSISHTSTTALHIDNGDINGDGIQDVVTAGSGGVAVRLGLGGGSFGSETIIGSSATANTDRAIRFADLNNDGALDIGSADNPNIQVDIYLGNTQKISNIDQFDLTTQSAARSAIDEIETVLNRISLERGSIGAVQSRFEPAVQNMLLQVENYTAARGTIMDVDVADETSQMLRTQILQQTGAAILSQAQQIPQLALSLLSI